jgi:hypothetical protein
VTPSASDLASATPTSRDRYVDFLRVAALGCVMVGHFLMAGVDRHPDGSVSVSNSLVAVPEARGLTWIFQVMPVFFVVGGFSHAVALKSLHRRHGSYADFAERRARRLLEPTAAFVSFGVLAAVLVELSGTPDATVEFALRIIGQPLWFVGIYLVVVACAPRMLALHDRFGVGVVLVLAAAVVVVDVARIGFDVPLVGYLNFLVVWLAIHQIGFFWADGRLLRQRVAATLAVGGGVAAVLLVAFGPYPLSMVSLPGERVSNLAPPSAALLALALFQTGVLVLLRDAGNRWLRSQRVWTVVVAANGVVMTAFLWHLTAIVVVNALAVDSGLPAPEVGSPGWWLSRIPMFFAVVVVLAVLVGVFRRFEQPSVQAVPDPSQRRPHRDGWAVVGLVLAVVGVLGFSVTGFSGATTLTTKTLVVLPVTPFLNLLLLVGGWWLVELAARPQRSAGSAPPSAPAGPTSGRDRTG